MALLIQRTGVLATAQAATGASANQLNIDEWNAIAVFIQIVATGTLTVEIDQSIDGGNTFQLIFALNMGTGAIATTAVTASALFRIDNPAGIYRTNITTFTSGSVSSNYKIAAVYQE